MVSKKSIAVVLLFGIVMITVIATSGCVNTEISSPAESSPADTLFLGNVITMDDKNPSAEAVAVKDGIILFVGSKKDAESYCGETTEIIDYGDNTIYPGFLEAHAHVSLAAMRGYGMAKLTIGVPLKQTVEEISAYIKENPGMKYYIGSGWSFSGDEEPTASMLDAVCSDVPVVLQSDDTHSIWVNSKALEIINYSSEEIKAFGPSEIRVDENGKPTGYISETPAFIIFNMLTTLIFSTDELIDYTLKWQDEAISKGYTGYCDAGIELFRNNQYDVYNILTREGKLKLRIYGLSLVDDNTDTPEEDMAEIAELAKKYNSEYFKIIGAKVFMDGIIEAHTGWMLDEYKDEPGYYGVSRFNDVDKLARLITAADKYGLLVHSHSIGDAASRAFADAVEKSVAETGDYDQRNAAAHLQYVKPEDIKRFGELGIVAVSGYVWTPKDTSYPYEVKCVGEEYAEKGYPTQSFINAGAVVVGHTDYPITSYINVPGLVYCGVTRTLPSLSVRGPEEVLSREDAVAALTRNVAYMWHEEDRMGTLEPEKLANMAIFSVDFLHDDLEDIVSLIDSKAVATIIDGKVVYQADENASKTA